jgi:predicted acylesterase/phospholipase RssA
VLSSGFLAFASHSGFLKAVEAAGLHVSGVMGTSAGALSGSLYCAGYSPDSVRARGGPGGWPGRGAGRGGALPQP